MIYYDFDFLKTFLNQSNGVEDHILRKLFHIFIYIIYHHHNQIIISLHFLTLFKFSYQGKLQIIILIYHIF